MFAALAHAVAGNGGCGGCGCVAQEQTWQRAKWGTPHARAAARRRPRQRGAPASGVSARVAASEAAGATPGRQERHRTDGPCRQAAQQVVIENVRMATWFCIASTSRRPATGARVRTSDNTS
jgi:hypothetical protein